MGVVACFRFMDDPDAASQAAVFLFDDGGIFLNGDQVVGIPDDGQDGNVRRRERGQPVHRIQLS